MTETDFANAEEPGPAQDVLVKCKGFFLCEDFEHKMELESQVYYFLLNVYEAANDFSSRENRAVIAESLKNGTCFKHTKSVLVNIDLELYLPVHFVVFFVENIQNRTESSISSRIEIGTGNIGETVKTYCFEKTKTDTRVEIECNGKLFFKNNNHKECLCHYENLAFKSADSFFKYPNTASPDIFITDLTNLHLRSHCFVVETTIEKNIAEIKKAFDASLYGKVIITINGKEQLFEKEADWPLVKSGETHKPYNYY